MKSETGSKGLLKKEDKEDHLASDLLSLERGRLYHPTCRQQIW